MKKEIGILTHWAVPNFGSFLQAYALTKALQQMFPEADVKQIAYSNKTHTGMYYGYELHQNFRKWLINPYYYMDIIKRIKRREQIKRIRGFEKYYYDYMNHTERLTAESIRNQSFSTIVLGSDILWDYSVRYFGYDQYMFGIGLDSDNIISYAASFGTVKRGDSHLDYVLKGIKELNGISVRDVSSQAVVHEITGVIPPIVLDPTLLWDFSRDTLIESKPILIHKYVSVYGSYFTEQQIADIKDYATKNNYKIVYLDSVGDKCDWCDFFIRADTMTPFEWCNYIKYSELLMTCTFHGLMFGLIFQRKILFNATEFMRAKTAEFLQYIGLDGILLKSGELKEVINASWDYDNINIKIDERRIESIDYLYSHIIV